MKTRFNPWPCGIILFFVLLICGLAAVVVVAVTHRESLVSDSYYEQELKFQDQIDAAARAKSAGATVHYNPASGRIQIALPAAQVRQQLAGRIELYRPSAASLDRQSQIAAGRRRFADARRHGFAAGPVESPRLLERRRTGLFPRTKNYNLREMRNTPGTRNKTSAKRFRVVCIDIRNLCQTPPATGARAARPRVSGHFEITQPAGGPPALLSQRLPSMNFCFLAQVFCCPSSFSSSSSAFRFRLRARGRRRGRFGCGVSRAGYFAVENLN